MERKRAVVAVVENHGCFLLGKRREDTEHLLKGQWHIPGEKAKDTETDEQALLRGIKEEAGIEIELIKFLGCYEAPNGYHVNWYLCKSENTTLIAGSDLEEVKWATLSEVLSLNSAVAQSLWPQEVRKLFEIKK